MSQSDSERDHRFRVSIRKPEPVAGVTFHHYMLTFGNEQAGLRITRGKLGRTGAGIRGGQTCSCFGEGGELADERRTEGVPDDRLTRGGRVQRVSELTATQLHSSALAWHEIADMIEEGASDEEIATVARAGYYRDQYGV